MPLNDLQDIIDAITAGTRAEKEAFADIVGKAIRFLEQTKAAEALAQRQIQIQLAQDWWDDTIKPTLVWNNTQSLIDQRANILIDYNMIKGLLDTETDLFRLRLIRQKLEQANDKFKQIKANL